MRRRHFLASTIVATVPLTARASDAWPQRPLRFVVPRAPGGAIDVAGRIIAESVSAQIGQPIVIEAKPGANGMIGAAVVAKAPPDGYTYLLATTNHLVAPLLQPAPYHPVRDFAAIAHLGTFRTIAVVRASLPVSSLHDLIAYARARPGELNYLNSGNGSTMHLATELLKLNQQIDMVSVQYKGMQVGIGDLLAGRLDFAFTVPSLVTQHIQSGKLRALAVCGEHRLAELPDVPTLGELGLPDLQLDSWFTLLGPTGTPDQCVSVLNAAAAAALQLPLVQQQLATNALDPPPPLSPAALHALLETEHTRYELLIREAGIKADP